MSSIALGTVVFKRTEKLEQLLSSITPPIEKVYVADNGEITAERRRVYSRNYPFDLVVLDLEYDSGLGYGRREIVKRLSEDYLVVVDCDMEIPDGIDILADQLDGRPDLGAVCGLIIEDGNVSGRCCDLFEEDNLIVKDIRSDKEFQYVAGAPLVEFDFIANAAMFRKECVEEYMWDPEYIIGKEHLDFYVAHKKETDWTFGICPAVVFPHFPGGDDAYMIERNDKEQLKKSKQYFLDKWGYRQYLPIQTRWVDSFSDPRIRNWRFLAGYGARMALRQLPTSARTAAMDFRDRVQYP